MKPIEKAIEELLTPNYESTGDNILNVFRNRVNTLDGSVEKIKAYLSIEVAITQRLQDFFSAEHEEEDVKKYGKELSDFMFTFYTGRYEVWFKKIEFLTPELKKTVKQTQKTYNHKNIIMIAKGHSIFRMRECLRNNRNTKLRINELLKSKAKNVEEARVNRIEKKTRKSGTWKSVGNYAAIGAIAGAAIGGQIKATQNTYNTAVQSREIVEVEKQAARLQQATATAELEAEKRFSKEEAQIKKEFSGALNILKRIKKLQELELKKARFVKQYLDNTLLEKEKATLIDILKEAKRQYKLVWVNPFSEDNWKFIGNGLTVGSVSLTLASILRILAKRRKFSKDKKELTRPPRTI